LLILAGGAGLFAPRDPMPSLGPALFVAGSLACVLWLTSREPVSRGRDRGRYGSSGPAAQQIMGYSGELQVRATLAAELPDEYVLLNGLTLPHGSGDLDHVVVGPSGLFLIETKTMAGSITCDALGNWRRTKIGRGGTAYGAYIGDPGRQVRRNIHALRECLQRRVPHVCWGSALWIEGLVVFPHPRTVLHVNHNRTTALRLDEIVSRIRGNRPRRTLQPHDVIDITAALLQERQVGLRRVLLTDRGEHRAAQALVELAMALPVLLALVFGIVALSRVVQAHLAIVTVAHEVARAGALGSSPQDARRKMDERIDEVVPGLGLERGALRITTDVSEYGRAEGQVAATARYLVNLSDLPLVGWAPALELRVSHAEWVDPYRAGIQRTPEQGP